MNPLQILLLSLALLILLFTALLFLPVRLAVSFDKKVHLSLKILCFSFKLFPKKKKWRMKDHLPEYQRKKKRTNRKPTPPKQNPKPTKNNETAIERLQRKYKEISDLLNTVIVPAARTLGKHLTISISRLELSVATGDAAKTALLYGMAVNGGYALLAAIDEHTNLKKKGNGMVGVVCRYDHDKTSLVCDLELGISLYGALCTLIPALLNYLNRKTN